jgi:hypothetical protein
MRNDWLIEEMARDERSVIALLLSMALVLAAYFAVMLATPGLPLPVHEALASLPGSPWVAPQATNWTRK